jgi:hypothetical protein
MRADRRECREVVARPRCRGGLSRCVTERSSLSGIVEGLLTVGSAPWTVDGVWLARCPHLSRRSFSIDVPDNRPESHPAARPFPGPRQASQSDVPGRVEGWRGGVVRREVSQPPGRAVARRSRGAADAHPSRAIAGRGSPGGFAGLGSGCGRRQPPDVPPCWLAGPVTPALPVVSPRSPGHASGHVG